MKEDIVAIKKKRAMPNKESKQKKAITLWTKDFKDNVFSIFAIKPF